MSNPTEIFAERLAVQTSSHDATDPRLIAAHFTAGWLAAVDALNVKGLLADLAPQPAPDAAGWRTHRPGDPMPCAGDLRVDVMLGGRTLGLCEEADIWCWSDSPISTAQVTKWRPAQPTHQP